MNSATVPQIDAYADVDGVGGGVAKKTGTGGTA